MGYDRRYADIRCDDIRQYGMEWDKNIGQEEKSVDREKMSGDERGQDEIRDNVISQEDGIVCDEMRDAEMRYDEIGWPDKRRWDEIRVC